MLTVANHQGNANQNHKEIPLIPVSMSIIQKTKFEGVEKKKLCVLLVECKLVQPLRKIVFNMKVLQKNKNRTTIGSSNSSPIYRAIYIP